MEREGIGMEREGSGMEREGPVRQCFVRAQRQGAYLNPVFIPRTLDIN